MITDQQYVEFMDRLAADVRGKNGLLLSDWENHFLDTYLKLPTGAFFFTPGRRMAIYHMWMKYGTDLKFPHPAAPVDVNVVPAAKPGCCMYWVRETGGRQQPCNAPAVWQQSDGKFLWCNQHGEAAEQFTKRSKRPVKLIKYP